MGVSITETGVSITEISIPKSEDIYLDLKVIHIRLLISFT